MPISQLAILLVGAYLMGSIPFGLVVSRLHGVDIRKAGSGNVGATNVGRVLGKKWGILVFLLDVGKGITVSLVTGAMTDSLEFSSVAVRDWIWLGAGAICVIGGMFPFYLRFRGGKGVAASLGVILGVYPYLTLPGLLALVLWAIVVKFSGYVSLGSLCAAAFLPVGFAVMSRIAAWPLAEHYPLLCLLITIALLVIARHRDNIRRLLAGTENRIGRPKGGFPSQVS